MSLYTYANIATEVRTLLPDPSPGNFVSDTEIQAWTDRGARNISAVTSSCPITATATGVLTQTETVTTVASTYRYSLTAQFLRIWSVTFEPAATTPFGLQRMDMKWIGHGFCGGITGAAVVPKFYAHFGNSLYIWPSPIGAANVGTYIKVYGSVSAEDYMHSETADIYAIPDRMQDTLIDYVMAHAYMKMGVFSKASEHMQNYIAALDFERKDNIDRKHTPNSKDMYEVATETVSAQR